MSARPRSTSEQRSDTAPLQPSAVFLVGHMGAGKSSVGRVLSQMLDWPFQDLDELIERREKLSVKQIFATSGEAVFRRLESSVLKEILLESTIEPRIVALGGGAFALRVNSDLLKTPSYITVFLDGSADDLFNRCQQQTQSRPLLGDREKFNELYELRREAYQSCDLRIDTTAKSIEDVARELATYLNGQRLENR